MQWRSSSDTPQPRLVSSTEPRLTCPQILQEWLASARAREELEGAIAKERGNNQALGYFGGLFPPLLLGTNNNDPEKQRLVELQARRDV